MSLKTKTASGQVGHNRAAHTFRKFAIKGQASTDCETCPDFTCDRDRPGPHNSTERGLRRKCLASMDNSLPSTRVLQTFPVDNSNDLSGVSTAIGVSLDRYEHKGIYLAATQLVQKTIALIEWNVSF